MLRRFAIVGLLLLPVLPLGGCTACGFLGDEAPKSCHGAAPRT